MGQVKDLIIADFKQFSQAEHSNDITFVTEDVIIQGLTSKHNLSIDPATGISVSSLNAHITVNESVLIAAGITTRNIDKQFIMKGKLVSFKDASGVATTYAIDEVFPNQTTGMIICTLGTWHS